MAKRKDPPSVDFKTGRARDAKGTARKLSPLEQLIFGVLRFRESITGPEILEVAQRLQVYDSKGNPYKPHSLHMWASRTRDRGLIRPVDREDREGRETPYMLAEGVKVTGTPSLVTREFANSDLTKISNPEAGNVFTSVIADELKALRESVEALTDAIRDLTMSAGSDR